jgi:hypothetical protein
MTAKAPRHFNHACNRNPCRNESRCAKNQLRHSPIRLRNRGGQNLPLCKPTLEPKVTIGNENPSAKRRVSISTSPMVAPVSREFVHAGRGLSLIGDEKCPK